MSTHPLFDPNGSYQQMTRYVTHGDGGTGTICREFSFVRKNVLDIRAERTREPQPYTSDEEINEKISAMHYPKSGASKVLTPPKEYATQPNRREPDNVPALVALAADAWGGLLKIDTSRVQADHFTEWEYGRPDGENFLFTGSGFQYNSKEVPAHEVINDFQVRIEGWGNGYVGRDCLFFLLRQPSLNELQAYLALTDAELAGEFLADVIMEKINEQNPVSSDGTASQVLINLQTQLVAGDTHPRKKRELLRILASTPQLRGELETSGETQAQRVGFVKEFSLGRSYPQLGADGIPFWALFLVG